jgi:hypothetical protein
MSRAPSWDTHSIRVAVAQIQGLIEGFVSDVSGDGFRRELEKVTAELGSEEVGDRVGLLLYAAAIVGAAGFSLAAELGREGRGEVRAMAGEAVNTWLDATGTD